MIISPFACFNKSIAYTSTSNASVPIVCSQSKYQKIPKGKQRNGFILKNDHIFNIFGNQDSFFYIFGKRCQPL